MTADSAPRQVILVGANPAIRLYDGDEMTAFASVWIVDWSERGTGAAIVLWHDNKVRLLCHEPELGRWLAQDFTRHFPEVAHLPWPEPRPERTEVAISLDPDVGLLASARDVTVEMSGVLDRRVVATDDVKLDDAPHGLSLVLTPMRSGYIMATGAHLPGEVRIEDTPEGPMSTAYLATAEVWRR